MLDSFPNVLGQVIPTREWTLKWSRIVRKTPAVVVSYFLTLFVCLQAVMAGVDLCTASCTRPPPSGNNVYLVKSNNSISDFYDGYKALKAGFEDCWPHILSLFYVDGFQISMEHVFHQLIFWLSGCITPAKARADLREQISAPNHQLGGAVLLKGFELSIAVPQGKYLLGWYSLHLLSQDIVRIICCFISSTHYSNMNSI